jgi:ABC-type sugar transport system ATPase subunit
MADDVVLEVRDARKAFGSIQALDGLTFTVRSREIVALLGDNGAGKSTAIKAITGVHRLDSGAIVLDGNVLNPKAPADARAAGIETVYQDLAVFDNLTARANFFVGREVCRPRWMGRLGWLQERAMHEQWDRDIRQLRVNIPHPEQSLAVLSGGQRQSIAVARAVAFATRLVILDEPTAALGVRESAQALELIRLLPARGVAVVLISHNLDHVMQVAQRAVVMRQGRCVGVLEPTPDNHERIVSLIVGAIPSGDPE